MVQVEALSKSYAGTVVVDAIDFEVARGEILVLVGKSGSGKTTTLKMINRLVEPSSGSIRINGTEVTELDPVKLRRQTGYVIQHHGLFPHYTVAENVGLVPRLLGWSESEIIGRVEELLILLELDPQKHAHKYPGQLSGGQQQRVSIARALAARPPLLLMDEPFSALDPLTRSHARSWFLELVRRMEVTVVLVTHELSEAIELADRILLMEKGRMAQIGTPGELLLQPAGDFVHSFFNSNRFELELKSLALEDLLPLAEPSPKAGGLPVRPTNNLFAILEKMTEARESRLQVEGVGSFDRTAILSAYFRYTQRSPKSET